MRLPLVVVLGATGSGKTKLSLQLAQRFGGEIVGADSMQIYKGLDIITAKATAEERTLAPHHLIDELHPHEMYTVVDFRNRALPIMDDILSRNKLPIIVGGTNYYIESLLWKILIEQPGKAKRYEPSLLSQKDHELPGSELHKKLQELDPSRARKLHPNDKRKILRSLEVLYQKGRKHSELLREQQTSEGGSALGGGLRFCNALIFWLQCEEGTLNQRLDSRVDSMLEEGLIDELLDFHKRYNERRLAEVADYTKGVFQSIGLKEFHDYLIKPAEERGTESGVKLFRESIEVLKRVTRRYARKQKRWITNRFLSKSNRKVPPVYALDTTDPLKWDENVAEPAAAVVECYIAEKVCPYEPMQPLEVDSFPNSEADTFNCEACERVFVGKHQWDIHLKSHRHRKVVQSKVKKFQRQYADLKE